VYNLRSIGNFSPVWQPGDRPAKSYLFKGFLYVCDFRALSSGMSLSVAIEWGSILSWPSLASWCGISFHCGNARTQYFLDGTSRRSNFALAQRRGKEGGACDRFGNGPRRKSVEEFTAADPPNRGPPCRIRGPHWFTFEHDAAPIQATLFADMNSRRPLNLHRFFWRRSFVGYNH